MLPRQGSAFVSSVIDKAAARHISRDFACALSLQNIGVSHQVTFMFHEFICNILMSHTVYGQLDKSHKLLCAHSIMLIWWVLPVSDMPS